MRYALGPAVFVVLLSVGASCGTEKASQPTDGGPGDLFACDGGSCTSEDGGPSPAVTPMCGDGRLQGTEACDDKNTAAGDGCSADCKQIENGWQCPTPGLACKAAKCGDGIIAGSEECDFPPGAPVTGCGADCKITPGYDCDPTTLTCKATVCGDGTVSRGEACEDGNELPFDGCFRCQKEPACTNGVCQAVCGDGQRFASEQCDDGNTRSGDGCSSDCKTEVGYTCTDVAASPSSTIDLPVLMRDFIGKDNQTGGASYHEDFNRHVGSGVLGIVENALGNDGRPVYACPGGDCTQNPGHLYIDGNGRPNTSTKENFDQWYRNVTDVNLASAFVLKLQRSGSTYGWDSADPTVNNGLDYFDPIGTGGWIAAGKELRPTECNPLRNVSFTSETHFWFEYQGGERFDFAGDDDTWIFLNGKLAIDLGGLHTPLDGYFSLDADTDGAGPDTADGTGTVYGRIENATRTVAFGLTPGGIYEAVMFQAERNQCGSNFKVTLKDFNRPKSACASKCGDGVVASDEVCDDGKNDGSYGSCKPDCKGWASICGDGVVDPGEQCDDGNKDPNDACTNACQKATVK